MIEATLVKDPRQRYASGGEFAGAIAAVRAGRPLPTPLGLVNAAYAAGQAPPVSPVPPAVPQAAGAPVGPSSNPAFRPLPAPPGPPVPPPKRNQWGWWVLLAVVIVVVLVALAFLIARVVSSGNGGPPRSVDSGSEPTSATPAGTSEAQGLQGMMTTPWTEWNGTKR